MTAEEIAIRQPVWIAMSDLFLDTDVRIWYPIGARNLAASPFTAAQLDGIFRREVRPVVQSNLMQVAGEWGGFDTDWLVAAILARGPTFSLLRSSAAEEDWQALAMLTMRLRLVDPEHRAARVAVWESLSAFFLNRDPKPKPPPSGWPLAAQLDAIWNQEMWPGYSHRIAAYYQWSPQLCPNAAEVQQAWSRFRASI